jgi:3-deoxy-manno-octulosonate cytidylyltransferase (CMP-KDO synthetase)
MKVIGIIPARYGSSRFPGKPLIELHGKTMVQRVYEGAKRSTLLSEVVVATDDERILNHVQGFGGKAIMTADTHTTGTDRCAEVVNHFPDAEVVLNIQGDEPLIDFRQLEALIEVFNQKEVQIATLGTYHLTDDELQNPNRIKIVVDQHHNALYFSRSAVPNPFHAPQDLVYPYLRHIGLYAFRKEVLLALTRLKPVSLERMESLEQLRWMYYGYPVKVVITEIETPNIDTPEDVEHVINLLKQHDS